MREGANTPPNFIRDAKNALRSSSSGHRFADELVWCLRVESAFCGVSKAPEDWRSPRRFAFSGAWEGALASWTAPVLWRYDPRVAMGF